MSKQVLFKMILAVSEIDREFAIYYVATAIQHCDNENDYSYFSELLALIEGN